MRWAKTQQKTRYTLATSGAADFKLAGLPLTLDELEISRGGAYGYAPLLEDLARHCRVPAENVVTAGGTSMANHLAMAALIEPGDEVLVEFPAYELLLSTLGYLQASIRRFPRVAPHFRLDPEAVERAMSPRTKLVVLTNLHNPSSAYATDKELRAVGEAARRRGARVLVDEVYLDARFDPAQRSSFHLGPEFVVTSSLTKVYGLSGLRCGWILAGAELARRMWRLADLFDVNQPHVTERLSAIALRHLERAREVSRTRLERDGKLLNEFLAGRDDLECAPLEAGTVVFPRLKTGNVEEFCRLFREKYEGSVVPGSFFEMPDHFRLGIGSGAAVDQCLAQLGAALDEFRARR
jgi:aspartate/methionine/tyrosine aminotransferase